MIAQALNYNGPALVEVLVSRQELSMPPTITLEQAKGFSLFMLKAVLNGPATKSSIWRGSIYSADKAQLQKERKKHKWQQ